MNKRNNIGLVFLLFLIAISCGRHHVPGTRPPSKKLILLPENTTVRGQKPYIINGERYFPISDSQGFVQHGLASWYGKKFHGRPTASGEIFDMNKLSAAHKTLPLGTYVRTINLTNNKQIVVKINDRGPFVKGRIIDLSYAAAKKIGLIGPGVARVKLTVMGKEVEKIDSPLGGKSVIEIEDMNRGDFTIQVGAFKSRENALRLSDRLQVLYSYVDVDVCEDMDDGTVYRVRVSKSKTLSQAQVMEKELESRGFDGAFIVSL